MRRIEADSIMSLDARAMLEVNREAIYTAASRHRGQSPLVVVSVATFGRGLRHQLLSQFEPYRSAFGHNQSLVGVPPLEWIRALLSEADWLPPAHDANQGFGVLGYAFKKGLWEFWPWQPEEQDGLF